MEEDRQKIFEKQKVLISLKNGILKFIRPSQNSVYDFRNPKGTQIKYSFQDNLKSICNCGKDTEASSHYLLRSQEYLKQRKTLLNAVKHIYPNILD